MSSMCSRVFTNETTKVWGCPKPDTQAPRTSSGTNKNGMKILTLSATMHPQYVAFQILLAINCSSYNGLSCQGMDFGTFESSSSLETNEKNNNNSNSNNSKTDNQQRANKSGEENNQLEEHQLSCCSYLHHLKLLLYSRTWLKLEFNRCTGIEALFGTLGDISISNTTVPTEAAETALLPATTRVDSLVLKFCRSSNHRGAFHQERHRDLFVHIFDRWKVRQLELSMEFTPEWTKEFCRDQYSRGGSSSRQPSVLEHLDILPDCTWHREAEPTEDSNEKKDNDNDKGTAAITTSTTQGIKDCWDYFCQTVKPTHPKLSSITVRCKTSDQQLAYLIDQAIAGSSSLPFSPSFAPMEKLYFGKWCSCQKQSLSSLSRILRSSGARHWKSLTFSRGEKLSSRTTATVATAVPQQSSSSTNANDTGNRRNHQQSRTTTNLSRSLLFFCQALKHASSLTKLELNDYLLGENELLALFRSLALASDKPKIERLSLFSCATVSSDVYERVLCNTESSTKQNTHERQKTTSSLITSSLVHNQLPELRILALPREASKALCTVLKSNTSLRWITNSGRTKTHEYYLDLNRGGRRILTDNPSSIPSLWPTILERAQSSSKDRYCGGPDRTHDVIYCLLRNKILLMH